MNTSLATARRRPAASVLAHLLAVCGLVVTGLVVTEGTAAAALPAKPAQTWGTNGRVSVILPVGDQIFVGGSFTAVVDTSGVSYPVSNIAVISASTGAADLSWQGRANNTVTAMTYANGKLYAGGLFSTMNGSSRAKLAALNAATGALDAGWTPSADAPVDAMAVAGSSVYVGGGFTTVTDAAGTHPRSYVAKLDGATGALDTGWTPTPDARARAIVPSTDGSRIYIGGDFIKVNNSANKATAALSATGNGAPVTGFAGTATNGTSFAPVTDIATDGARIYVAAAGSGGACTAMDALTGKRWWTHHTNGNGQSVRVSGGTAYCGGHFNGAGSVDGTLSRNKLFAVDTASGTVTSFAPIVNSALGVWALGSDASHLYAGGDFTKISGVLVNHYAMFVDSAAQTAPAAPTALRGTPGDTVVNLSWTPPANDGGSPVQKYKVYRRVGSAAYGVAAYASVPAGTTYQDTVVTNGTTYSYQVTATNAVGEGVASNEVTVTPRSAQQTLPGAPTGLTATGGSGSIGLSWTAPADDGGSPVTAYRVYRGTATGQGSLLTTSTGTGTTLTDCGVVAGTTYFYTVAAVTSVGDGPASNEASASATAGVPSAPALTGGTSGGNVHLSWTVPVSDGGSPITKYVVARDGTRLVTVSAMTTSYDDATAAAGTPHIYQVRAVNLIGGGPYSNKVTLTP